MKVLIVEDSNVYVRYITDLLKNDGHEVYSAINGKKGIDFLLTKNDIDIIFLDWNMPIMNGPEFLDELNKKKLCSAPVVMMTTENKPAQIQLALDKGAKEFIMKPVTEDILFCKLNILFGDYKKKSDSNG